LVAQEIEVARQPTFVNPKYKLRILMKPATRPPSDMGMNAAALIGGIDHKGETPKRMS
jgi:hypothetical protein